MAPHRSPLLQLIASPAVRLLFALQLLPADAIAPFEEESASQCLNDVCKHEKLPLSKTAMLQGHMAGSVTTDAKEDVLTLTAAVLTAAASDEALRTQKEKTKSAFGSLVSAMSLDGMVVVVHFILFALALSAFPMVYAYNVLTGNAPFVHAISDLHGSKWASVAWQVDTEEAYKYIGLDGAMFLEFINMSCKITFFIGMPMAILVAPVNIYYGGGSEHDFVAEATERNVKMGNSLYWRDALIVWYVVLVVQFFAGKSHKTFRSLRLIWLRDMQTPQSHTILIQNLAMDLCSDEALKRFMTKLFSEDAIESAFVVRVEDRPDAPFGKNGFVTFNTRRDVEVALSLKLGEFGTVDTNVVSAPPAPLDVEYEVLQQEEASPVRKAMTGRALMIGLFIIYLPLVFLVALVTSLSVLKKYIPGFATLCQEHPAFESLWEGIVGPAALTILPGFVPTFLNIIIQGYFAQPSISWCQSSLERWYFYFLVTFSLVVFSFSTSLLDLYTVVLTTPEKVFSEIFPALQRIAMFYLFFIPADMVTHSGGLLRMVPFLKFVLYKRSNDEEEARKLAEPEDQDYYGIGSRSARLTLILVIALVYCTIETYLGLLAMLDFMVCRIVYSYLLVYAESRKPDSGGRIWVAQLKQIQFGLILYVSLMASVIFSNSAGLYHHGPGYLSCLAFLQLLRDSEHLELERLPFEEVLALDSNGKQAAPERVLSYAQPVENSESS